MLKKLSVAIALCAATGFSPVVAQSADAKLSVSCTTDGQVVYREELPADSSFETRKRIKDAFPQAMCVFLTKDGGNNNASSYFGDNDDGLVSALAAITGGEIGERYPNGIERVFKQDKDVVDILGRGSAVPEIVEPDGDEGGYVNLTLGIYRNMEMEDILAHWRLMQQHGPTLSKLIPTLDVVEEITVLSIMDAPDTIANKICTEAATKGQGCIAFF